MTTELTPMQAELLKRSDAIMDSLGKTISTAVDFSKEQIPDIAYQYIAFSRAYSSSYVIFGTLLLVLCSYLILNTNKNWDDWSEERCATSIVGGALSGISGLMFVFMNLKTCLFVWFAPKVFLLQSLTSLIKG